MKVSLKLFFSIISLVLVDLTLGDESKRAIDGTWSGRIVRATVADIEIGDDIRLDFDASNQTKSGAILNPCWGSSGWPLAVRMRDGNQYDISLVRSEEVGVFTLQLNGEWLTGTYCWRNTSYKFWPKRTSSDFTPPNPAIRVPSEPPHCKHVDIQFPSNGTQVCGDLAIPESPLKKPLVVIIGGSDPYDSDPQVPGVPGADVSIWTISCRFLREGFPTLVLCDRGVGRTKGAAKAESRIEVLAEDVNAALDAIRLRNEVDAERVVILGWSQGGVIGSIVASARSEVKSLVLLATPIVPFRETVLDQCQRVRRYYDVRDDDASMPLAIELKLRARICDMAVDRHMTPDIAKVELHRELVDLRVPKKFDVKGADIMLQEIMQPMFRSQLQIDNKEKLLLAKCDMLALWGDKDVRVNPTANLHEMEGIIMKRKGDVQSIARIIRDVGHDLRRPLKGRKTKEIDAVDAEVLDMTVDWLNSRPAKKS